MTALRQDAYTLLERMPENKLYFLVDIMRGIENLYEREESRENSPAFRKLISLCHPIANVDEKAELASWREERFGYAGAD